MQGGKDLAVMVSPDAPFIMHMLEAKLANERPCNVAVH